MSGDRALAEDPRAPLPADRACRSPRFASILVALACAGCYSDMADQPRLEPLESSEFFADGRGSRLPVEGTVARGQLVTDAAFETGKSGGQFVRQLPVEVTRQVLNRGLERFNIYCSPCHGRVGDGQGMIVQRGYRRPPSYHIDRLRGAPVGHFFDVITNGFGAMPDLAQQVSPQDRWAIVAYLRALQWSQEASFENLPAEAQKRVLEATP